MAKFVPLMIWAIVFGVFSLLLLIGWDFIAITNNIPTNMRLNNDSTTASFYTDLNSTLVTTSENISDANEVFTNSSITTVGVTPYMTSLGAIWKVIKGGPVTLYNLFANYMFPILFGSAAATVLTSTIAAIIILITISAVVYWISRGEGG